MTAPPLHTFYDSPPVSTVHSACLQHILLLSNFLSLVGLSYIITWQTLNYHCPCQYSAYDSTTRTGKPGGFLTISTYVTNFWCQHTTAREPSYNPPSSTYFFTIVHQPPHETAVGGGDGGCDAQRQCGTPTNRPVHIV